MRKRAVRAAMAALGRAALVDFSRPHRSVSVLGRPSIAESRLRSFSIASQQSSPALKTFYADVGIDRATERRSDAAWISDAFNNPEALVVPVSKNRNIVHLDRAIVVSRSKLVLDVNDMSRFIFLGLTSTDSQPMFAVDVRDSTSTGSEWQKHGEWVDLRSYGPQLQACDAGLLAYARGMVEWNSRNRFCGRCGTKMISHHAGHNLKCSSSSCQNSIYPRLDPAVIMLVTCGKYVLLGRQKQWEQGRYSLLAGFIEVGETFEQAVVREVKEESGVDVQASSIQYVASQPWPFPSSLMVGFTAEAEYRSSTLEREHTEGERLSGVDEVDFLPHVASTTELEDARWFHRDFIKTALAENSAHQKLRFSVPGKHAIARLLMDRWVSSNDDETWPGRDVPTVKIDEVLMLIKDGSGNKKLVVRGDTTLAFHLNILQALQKEISSLGLEVEPLGGGKMEHNPEQAMIHVFGASQAYGPVNHVLTAKILGQCFPLHTISVNAEDLL